MIDSEEYQKLKTNLISLYPKNASKVIMVSGSIPREGASTVASNFAITIAKDSGPKVLLVDANLRHPTLHTLFELKNNSGLVDVVIGDAETQDVIIETKQPNLSLITAGNCSIKPVDVLERSNLENLVARLKDEYDYLIFDSAPFTPYSDGSILVSHMDGVILVVRAGKTRREVVLKVKEQLQRRNANIVGIVLNRREYIIPKLFYNRL